MVIMEYLFHFQRVFKLLGTNEILPNGKINELAGQSLCLEEAITQVLCTNLLFLICGFNEEQLNAVSTFFSRIRFENLLFEVG